MVILLILFNFLLVNSQDLLNNHHDNNEVLQVLDQIHRKCPQITSLYDLKYKTVKGFPLRVLVISDSPNEHEIGEPEFKYISNMHGNEVVGRELTLQLAMDICNEYLNQNQLIVNLVKTTRMHFLTTMNPDGWDIAVNNEWQSWGRFRYRNVDDMLLNSGVSEELVGRGNANDVDLNRNFPDVDKYKFQYEQDGVENKTNHLNDEVTNELKNVRYDCQNQPFQPETYAVMDWLSKIPFVLSANTHGGSLVANYPFDTSYNNQNIYSATVDDDLFRYLAKVYSKNHRSMGYSTRRICYSGDNFIDGITNGALWYPVCGGMQDYNYLVTNCYEITLELSCDKFPPGNQLRSYWNDNKKALYEYIWQVHMGVKGFVLDDYRNPVQNALIKVSKIDNNGDERIIEHYIQTTQFGEYWRLLLPGTYNIWAEKNGIQSKILRIRIDKASYSQAPVVNLTINAVRYRFKL